MATQKKIDTVADLTSKLAKARAVILADYRGLKHKQMEELRKILKKTEADFTVVKNRLLVRALDSFTPDVKGSPHIGSVKLIDVLNDTTVALFAYADEAAPLKELVKFFKAAGFGKLKAGILGAMKTTPDVKDVSHIGNVNILTEADLTRLSALPSREVLLGKMVGQLNSPIQNLHYTLQWNLRKFVYALDAINNSKS